MALPRRRRKLVERGGVEMFEIRVVQWFDEHGKSWTSYEVTTPDKGMSPSLIEVLGALQAAASLALRDAEPQDEELGK
jgi:hypothetical protein